MELPVIGDCNDSLSMDLDVGWIWMLDGLNLEVAQQCGNSHFNAVRYTIPKPPIRRAELLEEALRHLTASPRPRKKPGWHRFTCEFDIVL